MLAEDNDEPTLAIWPEYCDICGSKNILTIEDANAPQYLMGCGHCGHEFIWYHQAIPISEAEDYFQW